MPITIVYEVLAAIRRPGLLAVCALTSIFIATSVRTAVTEFMIILLGVTLVGEESTAVSFSPLNDIC
jgi:hypothetical protein